MPGAIHGGRLLKTVFFFASMMLVSILAGFSPAWGAQTVSITYRDEPLNRMLERLSLESGVRIEVRGGDGDALFSGEVNGLPLEDALRQIKQNLNRAIVWNPEDNSVTVFICPSSLQAVAGSAVSAARTSAPPETAPQRLRRFAPGTGKGSGGVSIPPR